MEFMIGTIYWIEHAPNPWVRAVAVGILGGIALFNWWSGANVPNMASWLGGYGACNDWNGDENTVPEFAPPADGRELTDEELAKLCRGLTSYLGPIVGVQALKPVAQSLGTELDDARLVAVLTRVFPPPAPPACGEEVKPS